MGFLAVAFPGVHLAAQCVRQRSLVPALRFYFTFMHGSVESLDLASDDFEIGILEAAECFECRPGSLLCFGVGIGLRFRFDANPLGEVRGRRQLIGCWEGGGGNGGPLWGLGSKKIPPFQYVLPIYGGVDGRICGEDRTVEPLVPGGVLVHSPADFARSPGVSRGAGVEPVRFIGSQVE